ncbi:hypothetical protein B0H17DRAFT_1127857 [Mycena rosella]|uniref:Uncharacterized protein n=1 Tax=Mycena rosella TaxID=1033263 RepID=A0AAD7E0H4_MYCRO|nr:hypothetical protein B0H17DRAFT_1127857 [Mycena rosella]
MSMTANGANMKATNFEATSRPLTGATFLDGKVDEVLQKAIGLGDQPKFFEQIIVGEFRFSPCQFLTATCTQQKLQDIADKTMSFTQPIFPQKVALAKFVEKARGVDVRYNACYVAYKTGYFEERDQGANQMVNNNSSTTNMAGANHRPPKSVRKKTSASSATSVDLASLGAAYIQTFLDGCHPPMSHLFEAFFFRARITGELPLQASLFLCIT